MANLSLVVDSTFKPFSFERYIQPWQIYGQAYKEQEDAYSTLGEQAEEWGSRLTPDSNAYNQYKSYIDALEQQASELAKNGLNPSSRQAMLKLKTRYNRDINPIKIAIERGRELGDEQRKLYLADPTLRFDNDFSVDRVDDLMANPSMSYSALSGKDIAARASALASQYTKTIMNDPKLGRLNKEYLLMKQQMGYTPEQILMEAMNDPNAPAELRRIREDIHNSLKDHAAYNRDWADTYISQGMHSGIGTASYTPMKDGEYIDAGQRASLARQDRQLALSAAQNGFTWKDGKWEFDEEALKKRYEAMGKIKDSTSSSSTSRYPRIKKPISIVYQSTADPDIVGKAQVMGDATDDALEKLTGDIIAYEDLTEDQQNYIDKVLQGDDPENYIIMKGEGDSRWFHRNDKSLIIVPKDTKVVDNNNGNTNEDKH